MRGAEAANLLKFNHQSRVPVVLQTEAAECGLACLAMVAGAFGFDTDLSRLRQRFSISNHGLNLKQLIDIAGRMNLSSRAIKVDIQALDQISTPCILHWDMSHFVVLKAVKRKVFIVCDPAFGERRMTADEFSKHFTGVALELTPTSEFEKREDKKHLRLRDFWDKIVGLKRSLVYVFLLALLLQFFGILSPLYMQMVVDDVLLRHDKDLLTTFAIGFGLLMLIEMGTSLLRQLILLNFSNRLNIQMSSNLFRHMIRLPMDYFAKRHMGDVVSRFGGLGDIQGVLTSGLVAVVIDGIMATITLAVMFYYSITLTVIVLVVVVLYALVRYAFYHPFKRLNEEVVVASAKESTYFMETIRGIQTLKMFQKENDRQAQWLNKFADVLNKGISIARWEIRYDIVNGFLFGIENILVIYIAASLVMEGEMSLGMIFAYMSFKNRFSGSINALIGQWIALKMLDIQLGRLSDITYTKAEDVDSHSTQLLSASNEATARGDHVEAQRGSTEKLRGEIEVRNLAYQYGENDAPVFTGVSFRILAGETVAIVGPSGCGKTTLLKCLMGLLTPTEGEVLIDGTPLQQLPSYRGQIAGVMQDDQLLSGSISDNIACFDAQVNLKRVEFCSRLAGVHDEIQATQMKYNTLVGDMGASLSGGQKQRVILARALYRSPRILFMDEATSHLDVKNEKFISSNIARLKITRVMVAHRPETVRSAERQVVLNQM